MKHRIIVLCSLLVLGSILLAGCDSSSPDYAVNSNWLAKPNDIDTPVDVFYVYPTIYGEKTPRNMDIRRPDLQARAKHLLVAQAGVYSPFANLFAPYYRQMTFAQLDSAKDIYQNPYFQIGANDVCKAFDYYLKHFNRDRPFILAGHSQGSMVLIDLMRKRLEDPALQKRLIAAYLIGYSVTAADLQKYPWLKPAKHAEDTGVIVSYNTQAPGATGSPVLLPDAICINPLNWKTDGTPAAASLNLGAVFFDKASGKIEREVPHYAAAQVDPRTGALVTTPPESLDIGQFPEGVYHRFDYAFWYRNLEANVSRRITAYCNEHNITTGLNDTPAAANPHE